MDIRVPSSCVRALGKRPTTYQFCPNCERPWKLDTGEFLTGCHGLHCEPEAFARSLECTVCQEIDGLVILHPAASLGLHGLLILRFSFGCLWIYLRCRAFAIFGSEIATRESSR